MKRLFVAMALGSALAVAFLPEFPEVVAQSAPVPAGYAEAIPGENVKFDMVGIPGGEFLMGSPENEADRQANEGPQHKVQVAPFWMGKCEVTWEEFRPYQKILLEIEEGKRAKADVDGVTFPTKPYVPADYGHGYDGKPAICMTHHCAMEYCRWLSAKTGKTYRLPTEAEWEYACRAGTTTPYFFGKDATALDTYAWTMKNSVTKDKEEGTTHVVGTTKPNAWGLYDMTGNVMEWTLDQYDKKGYENDAKAMLTINPVRVPNDRKWAHVCRGGHWRGGPELCRSAARSPSHPTWMKHDPQEPRSIWWLTKQDIIGFRVVRAVDELPALKGLKTKVTKESADDLEDE